MLLGEVLQVLVVGGDDSVGAASVEAAQYGFGYGSAYLRLGSPAKFVDEDQAACVAVLHHYFHVQQVGGVGAQVVLDGLLVANVDEDAREQTGPAALGHGDEQSALQHVL